MIWMLLARPLGKVVGLFVILGAAQLAGFPVVELVVDTLDSFGITFDFWGLL